jgi:Uma2 family endonuclease
MTVMGTKALVSAEEYLSSVYEPDMDYVDGELEDRNVGEKDHSKLQFRVAKMLDALGGLFVTIEARIQVSSTRFRVPDVCVYEREPDEQIFHAPPLLVVEILSPDDRMARMQRKIEDYHRMGCMNIWLLDPWRRKGYQFDGTALVEVHGSLTTTSARLNLRISNIFPSS